MAEAGEISLTEKGFLKDLIVDQDGTILSIAEAFDADNNLDEVRFGSGAGTAVSHDFLTEPVCVFWHCELYHTVQG